MNEPDLSTLPQRMHYAAEVVREASQRLGHGVDSQWRQGTLRKFARQFEAEDATETKVEELAEEIRAADVKNSTGYVAKDRMQLKSCKEAYVPVARDLIDAGWRKGESE